MEQQWNAKTSLEKFLSSNEITILWTMVFVETIFILIGQSKCTMHLDQSCGIRIFLKHIMQVFMDRWRVYLVKPI